MKILFICTGNTCRSVMAEALMKHLWDGGPCGATPEIYSAGLSVFNGGEASPNAREVLMEEGVDVSSHVSTEITGDHIRSADLIIVMTRGHREALVNMAPDAEAKVRLLKSFDSQAAGDPDIRDPFGADVITYKKTMREIKRAVEGLIRELKQKKE